jgi:hypothetical protein
MDKQVEPLHFFGVKGSKKGTGIKRVEFELDEMRTARLPLWRSTTPIEI